MVLKPMYKGVPGDFTTVLAEPFDASSATTMSVYNASILPDAPNWITVRMENCSCLATFQYTGISGNTLTGLTFEEADIPLGKTATYPAGSPVYWSLSNKLLNNMIDNIESGGAEGTTDYEYLDNKPKINSVELIGNKTSADFGIATADQLSSEAVIRANADSTMQSAIVGKVDCQQGVENAGKAMVVQENGTLAPQNVATIQKWGDITGNLEDQEDLADALAEKVDTVAGKGLSENDFTSELKAKLSGIAAGAQVNVLEGIKVNGDPQTISEKTVDIAVPTKVSELENDSLFATSPEVDEKISTHDSSADAHEDIRIALENKLGTTYEPAKKGYVAKVDENGTLRVLPGDAVVVSFASITGEPEDNEKLSDAFEGKVDKVAGKGLSGTDFTSELKEKLEGIEDAAQKNVQSDWTSSSGDSQILHKPFISTGTNMEVVEGILQVKTGTTADTVCIGNDARLSDARTPLSHATSHTDGTDDIQTANGFRNGLLSADDWITFNAKQDPITPNTAFNRDFGTDMPGMDGTASAGISDTVSRSDHVHPTDTTRASSSDVIEKISTHNSSEEAHADIRTELNNKLGTVYTSAEDGYIAKVDSYDHILKVVPGTSSQVAFVDITGQPGDNTALATALNGKQDTITPKTAFNKDFGDSEDTVCAGNDARLSDARTPTAHTHGAGDIASGTVSINRLPIVSTRITLSASDWSPETKQQSVTVTGVTPENLIQVCPDITDYVSYLHSQVRCISQAADSLTFACTVIPSEDISVNVVITG